MKNIFTFLLVLFSVSWILPSRAVVAQVSEDSLTESERPHFNAGDPIYADIDTADQIVYILLKDELWSYDLNGLDWDLLHRFESFPESLFELDFGFDPFNERLLLWSRGVGVIYEINLENYSIERLDQSFPHNNQFGHYPFFREGELHAFGGYGFWRNENIITFFNSRIKEWNIITVSKESSFPEKRIPYTGTYLPKSEELYIFGGFLSKNGRADDKNSVKFEKSDIWKFSFPTATWEKVDELEKDGWQYYSTVRSPKVGIVNSLSRSFYSKQSGNWYLPVIFEDSPSGIYFFKVYNIKEEKEFEPVEIPLGGSKEFITSNYLFDAKDDRVVLVGLDYLTNTRTLPVRIVTIAEDSLLTNLEAEPEENLAVIVGSIFFGTAILAWLGVLFWKRNTWVTSGAGKNNSLKQSELLAMESFNETERKVIQALWEAESFLETNDLEEFVWSEIDNYDYRRKLRNETIKSINDKFRAEFEDELVVRRKDANDNRRLLYGLNEGVVSDKND